MGKGNEQKKYIYMANRHGKKNRTVSQLSRKYEETNEIPPNPGEIGLYL